MLKTTYTPVLLALLCASLLALFSLGCAATGGRDQPASAMVAVMDNGKIRQVPAESFDEAAYLKEGYLRNTSPSGGVLYVRNTSDMPDNNPYGHAYPGITDPDLRGKGHDGGGGQKRR